MSSQPEDPEQSQLSGSTNEPACRTQTYDENHSWKRKSWAILQRTRREPCSRCFDDDVDPDGFENGEEFVIRTGHSSSHYHKPQSVVGGDD